MQGLMTHLFNKIFYFLDEVFYPFIFQSKLFIVIYQVWQMK